MSKYWFVNESMGSFLTPPNHPSRKQSIKFYDGGHGYIALNKDIYLSDGYSYVPQKIKDEVREIFEEYEKNKPPINNPLVKDWIYQVLGYFKNCFRGKCGSWEAGKLKIKSPLFQRADGKNLTQKEILDFLVSNFSQKNHAGIHCIKEYYPDYIAKKNHFKKAYWGKRKKFNA